METKSAWLKYDEAGKKEIFFFNEGYKAFLSKCKTERECVTEAISQAEKLGYKNLSDIIENGQILQAGDKVYANCMGKALAIFIVGKASMEKGMTILGAHIDSPRLDLKQNPLYEDGGLAMLDTHYYGGVKKYQWTALPLAMHGVVAKKDGTIITISVGEDEHDPVFGVSDLLVHLSATQLDKKGKVVVEGEDLNLNVGNIPSLDEKEPVKKAILQIIKEKYGFEEEDFLSAEIEIVPAGAARDYGFDRSMIMGYGHDDRVCAYPSMKAVFDLGESKEPVPERTVLCLLVDKEEIGSVGATGMQSRFFENTVAELMNATGTYTEIGLRRALANSKMLSSDVSAAFDPNYPDVMEKKNAAYLGNGLCFNKFTGSGGKSGSNDANAEYLAEIRKVLDAEHVSWQTCELGKVDQGGGGTIAFIMAKYGMEVIDSGVAVHNMHAPWELVSKVDVYEAYMGYLTFLRNIGL
ncbi:MAG: aminopeptidase [Lachnospiraceae bacterium]|nr:aminopeptidase [Lachnospiraceae bacterium]